MYKYQWAAFLLALILAMPGCSGQTSGSPSDTGSSAADASAAQDTSAAAASDLFTDRDFETGYDESKSALIQLDGDSAQCSSDAVEISGQTVTIIDEGTYILTGQLDDGMVIVDAGDTDKVQLVLDGVSIFNSTSAAIYVREADKVFLTTAAGSENTLSTTGEYVAIDDNNIDSVIFSKSDLTLNGEGSLIIDAAVGHGVVSKDDLKVTSGTYMITAASHGLSGKDSIRIADGSFTIQSGKDGIHAENQDDATSGFLYIANGSFDITAEGDGLSGGSYLQIEDGSYTVVTAGGSANAPEASDTGFWHMADTTETEDTASTKGIKADGDLTISGGVFSIDSVDDAVHSNANVTIQGGEFQISTGDDGVHADANLTISDGDIQITDSYEGLEGLSIDISGGQIDLVASDDGLNAAGGNDQSGARGGRNAFAVNEDVYINITGGVLYIDASGDGIDSNGNLTVSGGETYVSGPDRGGNGALDYNGEAVVSGGTVIATGLAQMAQNFGSGSTQGTIMISVDSQPAGSEIRLLDSSGAEILSWTPEKTFESAVIICPQIVEGETYTLIAGSSEQQITMDTLVYGSGGMGGGMGGPGRGGRQPGEMGAQRPEGMERPAAGEGGLPQDIQGGGPGRGDQMPPDGAQAPQNGQEPAV